MLTSWSSIRHVCYINLDARTDRRKHIQQQLANVGLDQVAVRFSAVRHERGSVGCLLSHIGSLELAVENRWDHVLILEDDAHFLEPALIVQQANQFLSNHGQWDVLLLAGNNAAPYCPVDDTCIQIRRCQSAAAYLVQGQHYIRKLLETFRQNLLHPKVACDMWWWRLQERDRWFLLMPLTVTQRHDHSDIEKKAVNYDSEMLQLKYPPETTNPGKSTKVTRIRMCLR